MARSLNNLSKCAQRLPSNCHDLSMISQWSSSDLHGCRGLLKVLTQSLNDRWWKQSLNERSTNAKWTLNERSTNGQGVLNNLIDLSIISQGSFNECQICPLRRRDGWEINERIRLSHRNDCFIAFERSLRDRAYYWSLSGRPTIFVLCKGPLRHIEMTVQYVLVRLVRWYLSVRRLTDSLPPSSRRSKSRWPWILHYSSIEEY